VFPHSDRGIFTNADDGKSFMTENGVVLYDVTRPIWSSVSEYLGQLEGSRFELVDWLVAFVTSEDSTHICDLEHKNEKSG